MTIAIIGNVGNQGYALPMVSAYPIDTSLTYNLIWNPSQQALDYVVYAGGNPNDLIVPGTLTVGGAATFGSTVGVTGTLSANSLAATINLTIGGAGTSLQSSALNIQGSKVVGGRQPGWSGDTGTPNRGSFDTTTVTLAQLAGAVMALKTDLTIHGLIGA